MKWHELHVCDIGNLKPLVLCISINDLRTHDEPDQTIWNPLPRKGEGERPGIKISRNMYLRFAQFVQFAQSAQSNKEVICWVTPPCFWAAKVDYNNTDQMSNWNTGAGIKYIWFVLEKVQCCKYYSLFCSVNSISSKITGYKLFLSQYIVNMLNRIICKEHQNSWVKYD